MKLSIPTYFLATTTLMMATLLGSSNATYLRRTRSEEEVRKGDPCSQLHGCVTCETLETLTRELKELVPRKGTNLYEDPDPPEIKEWKTVVRSMLISSPRCEDIVIPKTLKDAKYTTTRFTDQEDGNDYCVLASFETELYGEEGKEYFKHPWGSFIVRLRKNSNDAIKKVSIDIPHPRSDMRTYVQGTSIFKHSKAKTLILAGSDRYTNGKGDDFPKSSCDSNYNEADVAHGDQNMFQATVEEVDNYWQSRGSYTALQFHGMGTNTCPGVDGFFSDGNGKAPVSLQVNELRNNFKYQSGISGNVLQLVGEDDCKMKGTRNIQGRYLNGVSKSQLCSFSTTPSKYEGKFIQIEQTLNVRNSQYYEAWANAVTDTFPDS